MGALGSGRLHLQPIGECVVNLDWARRLVGRTEEQRTVNYASFGTGDGDYVRTRQQVVTPERALTLAPVYSAGRLMANSIASLPLHVYRRGADDTRQKLPMPQLFAPPRRTEGATDMEVLHDWLFRAVTSLAYRGNAVGLITDYDANDNPRRVVWLDPDEVYVQDDQPSGPGSFLMPIWSYRGQVVPTDRILHIPYFCMPGRIWGLSPIMAFAASVNTGISAHEYSNDWFASGGVPPGTFRNNTQTVPQENAKEIKSRLVQAIRSHEPIVYGNDWEYTPITISPAEARFIETSQLTATEVANVYGIPPEMIGGSTGGSYTYSSPEARQSEFTQIAVYPWANKLEAHFDTLLPRGQYVKFNLNALIRVDSRTRFENYLISRQIGLNNIDEIRRLEDEPPLPHGEGKDYTPLKIHQPNTTNQSEGTGSQQRLTGKEEGDG